MEAREKAIEQLSNVLAELKITHEALVKAVHNPEDPQGNFIRKRTKELERRLVELRQSGIRLLSQRSLCFSEAQAASEQFVNVSQYPFVDDAETMIGILESLLDHIRSDERLAGQSQDNTQGRSVDVKEYEGRTDRVAGGNADADKQEDRYGVPGESPAAVERLTPGGRIAAWCEQRRESYRSLAGRAGISPNTLQKIRLGKRVHGEKITAVAEVMKCSYEDLLPK